MAQDGMKLMDPYSPERLRDRSIILDVLNRWCRIADRLDLDAIFDVFHTDAVDNHGAYNGDIVGFVSWMRERHRHITLSVHQITNTLIEFRDERTALVETTVCTIQRHSPESEGLAQFTSGMVLVPGRAYDYISSARYIDLFEMRPEAGWKIAQRNVATGWRRILEVAENAAGTGQGKNVQRRDRSDLVYELRDQFGIS